MIEFIKDHYPDDDILMADGFDDACIGIDTNTMRLIYSVSKCLKILQKDMSEEEAENLVNECKICCKGLEK